MSTSYRIADDVRALIDDDGAVLLDVRQGKYFSLNELGVEIWRQLEAGRPLADIEAGLAAEYDAPLDTVRGDLAAFVERLAEDRLIHLAT